MNTNISSYSLLKEGVNLDWSKIIQALEKINKFTLNEDKSIIFLKDGNSTNRKEVIDYEGNCEV